MKKYIFLLFLILFTSTIDAQRDSGLVNKPVETVSPLENKKEATFLDYIQISNMLFGGLITGLIAFLIQKVVVQGKINNDIEKHSHRIEKKFDEEKKRLEVQFQNSINLRKEKIESWIQAHDRENELIENCKLLLVGQKNQHNVRKLLLQMGFRDENILSEDDVQTGVNYQIIFINNETAEIQFDKTLLGWVNNMPSTTLAFYYDKTRTKHFPTKDLAPALQAKVNFVNAPAQIFGNLMNTIKYRERLEKYSWLK